jgi:hypothetical protein
MAKSSKAKPLSLKKPIDPEIIRRRRRIALNVLAALLLIGGSAFGFHALREHVDHRLAFPSDPPTVVLKNCPAWMSQFLAEQIINVARPNGIHSSFDHEMLVDTVRILRDNPWVKSVKQVRRVYGKKPGDTLEIDCEYRTPVALVHWGEYYWLVDSEGVKLPEAYSKEQVPKIVMGRDNRVNIRVIEGVQAPPPHPGVKWAGADLAAGIDMVKLLFGRSYTEEITRVDVANFAGRKDRKEAKIVLRTKRDTEIRWGEPINSTDFVVEVSPTQKLTQLEAAYIRYGHVDGNHSWIDVRLDDVTYPSNEAEAQANYEH